MRALPWRLGGIVVVLAAMQSGCPRRGLPTAGGLDELASAEQASERRSVLLLVSGRDHTCALFEGGGLSWRGDDTYGQLGDGPNVSTLPVRPDLGLVGFVAAGDDHTCAAVGREGAVWCWGRNDSGQLGDGSVQSRHAPVKLAGVSGVVALFAGQAATCARDGSARAWCWGDHPWSGGVTAPRRVEALDGARGISVGTDLCAVGAEGTVSCWDGSEGEGTPASFQVSGLRAVTWLAASGPETCAVADGSVSCWRDRGHGAPEPRKVDLTNEAVLVVVRDGGCALAPNGLGVQCFNWHGEEIRLERGREGTEGATLVSRGARFGCIAYMTGVACWGDNLSGQIGRPGQAQRMVPVPVKGLDGVIDLAAGADHTCAVEKTGRVLCWGANQWGQVGDRPTAEADVASVLAEPLPEGEKSSARWELLPFAWDRYVPTEVEGIPAAVQVAAGREHACVVLRDGSVSCWGRNNYGQLGRQGGGNGPGRVMGLRNTIEVAAAGDVTCAWDVDGNAFCWGDGIGWQPMPGARETLARTMEARPKFKEEPDLPIAVEIVRGASHGCARNGDGTVQCWRDNDHGQLGSGKAWVPGIGYSDAPLLVPFPQ